MTRRTFRYITPDRIEDHKPALRRYAPALMSTSFGDVPVLIRSALSVHDGPPFACHCHGQYSWYYADGAVSPGTAPASMFRPV